MMRASSSTFRPCRALAVVAAGTLLVLLAVWLAMQFTDEVAWDVRDFVVMAGLLLVTGTTLVTVSGRLRGPARRWLTTGLLVAFLAIWAELAVGVFSRMAG
ncbi:MAG: hypothetical protein KF823_02520 [Xanthomonadales bacterium]|nr:hypothetical protein [Xanthomonadales bacterium]